MKLRYYGHSCFLLEVNGKKLLFDPFITPNPLARSIKLETIQADYILVSHGHQDHLADAVALAKSTNAKVISSFEVINWFNQQGINNTHAMNHGGVFSFDFGKVKYVNAVHSSSFPDGSYAGNPGGFVITGGEKNVYYAGDTALTMDMQLIPRYAKIHLAILPIGDNLTMGVDDAIIAAEFVQCNQVMGVHYDTFEGIKLDWDAARKKFGGAAKTLLLPEIGQELEF